MRRLIVLCLMCLTLAAPLYAQDNTLTPYEIALQRIEAARESAATELDLSYLGLTELPPEIEQLSKLSSLYLHNNQLTTLPSEIGQLSNLYKLNLAYNQLTTLPPEIGQLNNLHLLDLGENQLTTLPSEVGQLSSLQVLYLAGNQLVNLPPEIGQLRHLCSLQLFDNNLQHLPSTIGNLNFLVQNETCYPFAYDLPFGGYDPGLTLYENPLISPPPEVVWQGTVGVLAYLRNQAWYHMQRLIVGAAGGVGLFALLLLGFRWKQRGGRKPKQKRG